MFVEGLLSFDPFLRFAPVFRGKESRGWYGVEKL